MMPRNEPGIRMWKIRFFVCCAWKAASHSGLEYGLGKIPSSGANITVVSAARRFIIAIGLLADSDDDSKVRRLKEAFVRFSPTDDMLDGVLARSSSTQPLLCWPTAFPTPNAESDPFSHTVARTSSPVLLPLSVADADASALQLDGGVVVAAAPGTNAAITGISVCCAQSRACTYGGSLNFTRLAMLCSLLVSDNAACSGSFAVRFPLTVPRLHPPQTWLLRLQDNHSSGSHGCCRCQCPHGSHAPRKPGRIYSPSAEIDSTAAALAQSAV